MPPKTVTGRCYCGAVTLRMGPPETVAYCHCADCRRWTGGPVGAFAAFNEADVTATPALGTPFSSVPGVERWRCADCGSPLAARFDYLPGQLYVPVGLLDDADAFPPEIHCHAGARLAWLHLQDDLPKTKGSGRETLVSS